MRMATKKKIDKFTDVNAQQSDEQPEQMKP